MSVSALARRIRSQFAEVRALQTIFDDSEWRLESQSTFTPLLAYTAGRTNELDYFRTLLSPIETHSKKSAILSASKLIEKHDAQAELARYIEEQIERCLQRRGGSPGEVFEDLYDIYDLFFATQIFGRQYDELLARVVSAISVYLESREADERRDFERSILNLKSSNLCFSGEHSAFSRNPSKLFSPLLSQSTAAVDQSHGRILDRIFDYYDRDPAGIGLASNLSSVLRRLIELGQQEGDRVIQTIRNFSNLLFEGYETVRVIPGSDESLPYLSTVIVATTPRYRGQGSPDEVMSSLSELLSRSKADNLAVFILSNQSGFKKVLGSPYFPRIEANLRSERKGILIPLVVKKYQVDFALID